MPVDRLSNDIHRRNPHLQSHVERAIDVVDARSNAPADSGCYASALFVNSNLHSRNHSSVRASTMLSMQQTHGNRAVQRKVSVQRDPTDEARKLRLHGLPPRLDMPLGPLDATLRLGGPELNYSNGPLHAGARYGWGGPLELGAGYGAPLLPWMMDVDPAMAAGTRGMNSVMNNPSSPASGSLGALGGMFGTMGDISDAGEHSRYNWGVGLQANVGPDEQRVMAGLRLNY